MIDPSQIKPALYAYDQYQTYDLLWAQNIFSDIRSLLIQRLEQHYLFDGSLDYMPVCLIERFTPNSTSWADHWSTQNYGFLKALSKTEELFIDMWHTGNHLGFPNQCGFSSDVELELPEFPESLTLTLAPNREISISWLEHAHSELTSGQIHPDYKQKCLIFNQKHQFLKSGDRDRTFTFDTRSWLINSLAISDPNAVTKSAANLVDGDEEFKDFLDDVEKGFTDTPGIKDTQNPYGRDYNQRPRVKDISKDKNDAR